MLNHSADDAAKRPAAARRNPHWDFFQPYADFDVDFLYNTLFCDSVALFRRDARALHGDCPQVSAEPPSEQVLRALAGDGAAASRLRALACHRLRTAGHVVDGSLFFGVVIELPHAHSQETLAAFADGRVHFIRHCGAIANFDRASDAVATRARKLVAAAQRLVERFTDADSLRRPPPAGGAIRITLLTGAGPFCVEGRFNALQKDPLAGPVLGNAIWLLQAHTQLEAG
jgi:hypothetical protein